MIAVLKKSHLKIGKQQTNFIPEKLLVNPYLLFGQRIQRTDFMPVIFHGHIYTDVDAAANQYLQ